jgi:hypothetical protein
VLPAYARHAEFDNPAIVRVLTDHVDLRRRGQDVEGAADPDPAALRELGERLELFPMIEEALPPDELDRLASAIEHAEAG